MVLATEDKISIKAQRKAVWQANSLLSFLTKPGLCLAWVTPADNRGHRLSGEEAKQQDKVYGEHKTNHWISSGTGSKPRKSAGYTSISA